MKFKDKQSCKRKYEEVLTEFWLSVETLAVKEMKERNETD